MYGLLAHFCLTILLSMPIFVFQTASENQSKAFFPTLSNSKLNNYCVSLKKEALQWQLHNAFNV